MYMERAIQEQREILTNVEYLSLWLLVAVLSPISVSIFVILKKNRLLLAEVAVRKKAEEDLKKGEEKYRSIFENAMGGIYQTSVDGRLIDVNPAFARTYGYGSPREMLENVPGVDRLYADFSDRQGLLRALGEKGVVENYVLRMKRRDGSLLWISNNSRVVRDEGGNIVHYEGTIEDITERKETERIIREKEEHLSGITRNIPGVVFRFYAKDSGERGLSYHSERFAELFGFEADMDSVFSGIPVRYPPGRPGENPRIHRERGGDVRFLGF